MTLDPYGEFAAVYDRWQWLHSSPFSAAMIVRMRQAVTEWGVPEKSLLDLACGTGTLAWWWHRENPEWSITGVDRSAAMIERARARGAADPTPSSPRHRKLRGNDGPGAPTGAARRSRTQTTGLPRGRGVALPEFVVQDMRAIEPGRKFGMATCFFDSLNHVTRRSDLSRTLERTRRALLPGGLFLFDLIDEDSFAEIFSSPWIVQGDGLFVGTESELVSRRGAEYGRVRFTFFEDSGKAGWIRREAEILERCWHREEFDPIVADAGLEIIHVQLIDPEDQAEVFVPRRLYVCRPH
jgi:SAM-dependent methyltransferase